MAQVRGATGPAPGENLGGGVVPQDLAQGLADGQTPTDEAIGVAAVGEHPVNGVAHPVRGGLVTGHDGDDQVLAELLVAQTDGVGCQPRGDIGTGTLAHPPDERLHGAADVLVTGQGAVAAGELVGERPHQILVFRRRHSQSPAHHHHRQQQGVVGHQLGTPAVRERLGQVLGVRLALGPELDRVDAGEHG